MALEMDRDDTLEEMRLKIKETVATQLQLIGGLLDDLRWKVLNGYGGANLLLLRLISHFESKLVQFRESSRELLQGTVVQEMQASLDEWVTWTNILGSVASQIYTNVFRNKPFLQIAHYDYPTKARGM